MKCSVCITTYNGSKFIKDQLLSILSQLDKNDEVIVSDDSSSDNTLDIIYSINDERIKVFTNNKFFHHTPNFEFAISKATGNYIFLSDQDDIWLPNKVTIMKQYLDSFNLVISDCFVVDSDLNIIKNTVRGSRKILNGILVNLIHNNYLGCCMAFDRLVLEKALPFPQNILSHESWLGSIAGVFGKTIFIDEKLILYRRHNFNYSNTLNGSNLSLYFKLKYRFYIILNLVIRKLKTNKYA
jgi:glycosyltransferase involved in cell wall biosynthesis